MKQTFEKIKEIISEKTGVEKSEIKPEAFFMEDLNIDEMELAEIITEVEEILNLEQDIDIKNIKSVGDLLHSINELTE
ncbi:hypothetical protein A2716_01430 [candidate division WWE3 bacterium RIFCSPHIGHO2_01_FULL_40_23]|uniref:Acyl carrier protein n=1 Tax=candidate division WWE3 bacterium RIFCSPLOWO2_01_FULL_41_18 TaxID=1802625 RepID=A0A1F4VEL2_UNCKA|nr:MAG: hypothetical protein A2716_01430 [candidate division WWE3 bacterium RIFCSPHIGHO2_01_FULL_40_23]OGC55585.1 MAG: hypothetical protein A3A78_00335 [candidate division WWE3 bacterium RIFCSPLOWO2_01_FULL_41_18]